MTARREAPSARPAQPAQLAHRTPLGPHQILAPSNVNISAIERKKTMGDQIRDIHPRERRYSVLPDYVANVTIEGADNDANAVSAKLVDLSRTGAELSVATCPAIDDAARLLISVAELQIDLAVAIEVCWAEPGDDDSWRLGCKFEPELSGDVVEQLAAGGILERRASPRTPVSLRATACWEHEEARIPVRLHDISEGGFCMSCAQIGQSERRLLLHLSRTDGKMESIQARMQWRLKKGDQYMVGCALENVLDYHRLRAVADTAQRELETRKVPRTPWIMFGSVASITFLVSFLVLSFATRKQPQPSGTLVVDARPSGGGKSIDRPIGDAQAVAVPPATDLVISEDVDVVSRVASKPAPASSNAEAPTTAATAASSANEDTATSTPAPQPTEPQGASREPRRSPETTTGHTATEDHSSVPDKTGGENEVVPPTADESRSPVVIDGQAPAADGQRSTDVPPTDHPYGIREILRRASESRRAARQQNGVHLPDETAAPWTTPATAPSQDTPADRAPAAIIAPPVAPPADDDNADPLGNSAPPSIDAPPAHEPQSPPTIVLPPVQPTADQAPADVPAAPPQPVVPPVLAPADEPAAVIAPPTAAPQSDEPAPPPAPSIATPRIVVQDVTPTEAARAENNPHAIVAYNRGYDLYRKRQYALAAAAFQEAMREDAANPLYHYTLALAQYQMGQRDVALQSAKRALELERTRPIARWGNQMQSYQGAPRLWLEKLRSAG